MISSNFTPDMIREKMRIIHQQDGGVVTSYCDESGDISSTVYQLFPGVTLIYKDVHRPGFVSNWRYPPDDVLVIEYCREGRIECQVDDDCLFVAPGDTVIFKTDHTVRELFYPLNHYHAIAINISLHEISPHLAAFLDQINTDEHKLMQRYMLDSQQFCVLKKSAQLEQIFGQILNAPDTIKCTYYSVKVFEILLLLAAMIPQVEEKPSRRISMTQAQRAKEVHRYLMDHPQQHITIEELAQRFSVSTTMLKQSFRAVYGMPIQTFIREQKMEAAALMLKQTNLKISDIASRLGYSNASKFSSAFLRIMGKSPYQYRTEIVSEDLTK